MDDLLEALQFAEARLEELGEHELVGKCAAAFAKYKAEQEPVAWAHWKSPDYAEDPAFLVTVTEKPTGWQTQSANWFPLYAAPVRTKDLTSDELSDLVFDYEPCKNPFRFARAVIAAHKEKNR